MDEPFERITGLTPEEQAIMLDEVPFAPPPDRPPDGPDWSDGPVTKIEPLATITPSSWKGKPIPEERWLAFNRVPGEDLTIYSGDGGTGKTETALQLCVHTVADIGDWLGCVIENGPALFFSAEEPEAKLRKRVSRICQDRGIDIDSLVNLHLHFPDLEDTFLATADRSGKVRRTPLMDSLEETIRTVKPRLVVIDNTAAAFDGEVMVRRQVRQFCAILRKIAQKHGTAVMLLDHPSVRGMSDGSGTANSVDWRNSCRSYMYLSEGDDPDERQMKVTKANDTRKGETIRIRWNGTTFSTAPSGPSPVKAQAERAVDQLFLQLLKIAAEQFRYFGSSPGVSYAPARLAEMPEANRTPKKVLVDAMQRLFAAGKVKLVPNPTKKESKAGMVIVLA
jgi:RecA-family ATPase